MHECIVDSGCSKHMTPYGIHLSNYKTLAKQIPVMTGSKQIIYAVGMGDVYVITNKNVPLKLRNVLHVPKLVYPLISVVQIVKNHGEALTKRYTMHVRHHGKEIFAASHKKGLFRTTFCMRNMPNDNANELHALSMNEEKDNIKKESLCAGLSLMPTSQIWSITRPRPGQKSTSSS